jgi:hypothetical protein
MCAGSTGRRRQAKLLAVALPALGEELGPLLVEPVQQLDCLDVGHVLRGRAAALELD